MGYMARHYEPSVRIDYSELEEFIEVSANTDGEFWRGVNALAYVLRNHRFNTADQLLETLVSLERGEQ